MEYQQDRRERIAAQVLAGLTVVNTGQTWAKDAEAAVVAADALIAELDRTAPAEDKSPKSPGGWVIWEDGYVPHKDGIITVVAPFTTREEAEQALRKSGLDGTHYVRRWPLDPAEDKPEVKQ